jgi:hypothetical protein
LVDNQSSRIKLIAEIVVLKMQADRREADRLGAPAQEFLELLGVSAAERRSGAASVINHSDWPDQIFGGVRLTAKLITIFAVSECNP